MALISCTECNKEISELAEACPSCGAPNSVAKAAAPDESPPPKKSRVGTTRLLVSGVVLIAIVSIGVYKVMSERQRDTVNRFASNFGVPVTPWIDRAQAARLKRLRAYNVALRGFA